MPSWNDGAAKKAIITFVYETTDPSNKRFVPPESRVATFDQDGTTWVSHPIYTQVVFCLDRVPDVVAKHPEVRAALKELGGTISADEMRRMNYAVDGEHKDVKDVVREFLARH